MSRRKGGVVPVLEDKAGAEAIGAAKTVFVNAVMRYTPHFMAGSQALDNTRDLKRDAMKKMYGGGDTLQEFKSLCPGPHLSVMDDASYYFFTGGGTVLTAREQGSPCGLRPVQALGRRTEPDSRTGRATESLRPHRQRAQNQSGAPKSRRGVPSHS